MPDQYLPSTGIQKNYHSIFPIVMQILRVKQFTLILHIFNKFQITGIDNICQYLPLLLLFIKEMHCQIKHLDMSGINITHLFYKLIIFDNRNKHIFNRKI